MDLHPGEEIVFEGHPSWRSTLGFYLAGIAAVAVVAAIAWLVQGAGLGALAGTVALGVLVAAGLVKRMSTRYVITNQRLHIRRGVVARHVQQTRIDRVQNVNTDQGPLERVLRVGTVDFDTAGSDDSDFTFRGIAEPHEIVTAVDRAQREQAQQRPL